MKTFALLFVALAAFLLPASSGHAQDFEIHVQGARKIRVLVGMETKFASVPVNNASLFADFGVEPKKYAVVFGGSTISLKPRSASSGLPTRKLFDFGSGIFSSQATKPRGLLQYYSVTASPADTAGTPYQSFDGRFSTLTKATDAGGMIHVTGVTGTVTGAAPSAATPSVFTFSFSGTKVFQQTP